MTLTHLIISSSIDIDYTDKVTDSNSERDSSWTIERIWTKT